MLVIAEQSASFAIVLVGCAWLCDAILGDPEYLPHPVRLIGRLIAMLERRCVIWIRNRRIAGICLGLLVTCVAFGGTLAIEHMAYGISFWLGAAVSTYLLYTCLSTRGLGTEAGNVLQRLRVNDILSARAQVARIVGRDTQALDSQEIVRATVESVSENTVDGIIAPLLYAFIGGAPLAMAYKAINTLDSMIGYKNEQYRLLGWFSARLDDAANLIPARLCLLLVPLAALFIFPGRAIAALSTGLRDGRNSPSPNSGYPEACFAGALGIQLGGVCSYGGAAARKPFIGEPIHPLVPEHIGRAIRLMWLTSACGLALIGATRAFIGWMFGL
jgi:adenosylcobinamide-phosphate synthase